MFRHPQYLEFPWAAEGHETVPRNHRLLWWLIAGVTLLALFLIGVGVTSGTF